MEQLRVDPSQLWLTRAEYWLLETAVENRIPLRPLIGGKVEEFFNKAGHGLLLEPLVDCLASFAARGLIELFRERHEQSFSPTREQIRAAIELTRPDVEKLWYGLTDAGGATWEAFAAPFWDSRIVEIFDRDTMIGKVDCSNRRRLLHYLEGLHLGLMGVIPDADTIQIAEQGPWQATYWKQLPAGFCATFAFSDGCGKLERLESLLAEPTRNMRHLW